jgi:hypothetical protein
LEVLILKDFKSLCPEVLILGDFKSLFPEVLILVDFKTIRLREIWKFAKFLEVLILGELWAQNARMAGFLRLIGEGGCSRFTSQLYHNDAVIVNITYALFEETLWKLLRIARVCVALRGLQEYSRKIGLRARLNASVAGARIGVFMLRLAACYDFWLVGA